MSRIEQDRAREEEGTLKMILLNQEISQLKGVIKSLLKSPVLLLLLLYPVLSCSSLYPALAFAFVFALSCNPPPYFSQNKTTGGWLLGLSERGNSWHTADRYIQDSSHLKRE